MPSYLRMLCAVLLSSVMLAGGLLPAPASAEDAVTTSWVVRRATLADGRTYFVNRPACTPVEAAGCVDFLAKPRPVVVYLHSAGQAEDGYTAARTTRLLRTWSTDTVFAFAVSALGDKYFDAGLCCTPAPVDDVGYLAAIVEDLAAGGVAVDRDRVAAMGVSNGGMLAERAACERPQTFRAAASISGTFSGACDVGTVHVRQWHGAVDPIVPVNGGGVWILGQWRVFKPAASLAQRMQATSTYQLDVLPGLAHFVPLQYYRDAVAWLDQVPAR